MTEFRLRFPLEDVRKWADRYSYADDAEVEAIGREAGRRGWYTREEFLVVARWKVPRSQGLCAQNSESAVRAATAEALMTRDERRRLDSLTALRGVGTPTASVLLHLAVPERFPIIDFTALWSLGLIERPQSLPFWLWIAYVEECQTLAGRAGVSMRTFDRALWQYSKEHQPAIGPADDRAPAQVHAANAHGSSARVEAEMQGDIRADVYARLVEAAVEGRTVAYSDLPGGRGHIGSYLYRIADYEKTHGRPPLTALVVRKQTGRPGDGFPIAMEQVSFARPGESATQLWERAKAAVFDYWRPTSGRS